MELLANNYASSSSDDEAEQRSGGATPSQPVTQQAIDHDEVRTAVENDEAASGQLNVADADAARAAIARRFEARAATATHRATTDERRFVFKPYVPKHRPRRTPEAKKELSAQTETPSDPLFAKLRAAPLHHHSQFVSKTTSTARVPHVQDSVRFVGHTGAVYCLDWNPRYPSLFLSASMDHSIRVWSLPPSYYDNESTASPPKQEQPCCRVLRHHTQGVKSAKWSLDGQRVWSGGYDGRAAYVDVESSKVLQIFTRNNNEHITSVCIHPQDSQLALFGTDRGRVLLRDLRMDASAVGATYGTKTTGEVHDLMFLPDNGDNELKFVSSSALTARDTSHQTLVVWDFRSSAMISDHLNNDLCAFTSLRLHPNNKAFVAQSTEGQAVYFSALAPYKRLKPKKIFASGHEVEGFSVGCSFNAAGSLFATGDINGRVVFYCARTQRLLRQSQVYSSTTPCLSAEFHPRWPSTLVTGGYDGRIALSY